MNTIKENFCFKGDCWDFWPPSREDSDCASRACALQKGPVCQLTKSFELVISHLEKGSGLCIPQGCVDPEYKNVINQSHSLSAMQINTTPNDHNNVTSCPKLDSLDSSYIGAGNGNVSTLIEGALPLSLTDVSCIVHDLHYTIAESDDDFWDADNALVNNIEWNEIVHNVPTTSLAKSYFKGLIWSGFPNPAWGKSNLITDSTKEQKDKLYYVQRVFNALLKVASDPANQDVTNVTGPSLLEKRVIVDFGFVMKWYINKTGKFNFYKDFGRWLTNKQALKDAILAYTNGPTTAGGVPLIELEHGPIESWDVSAITNMDSLFLNNTVFNGDISTWDMSNVTTMYNMFDGATSFNQDISAWDLSSVKPYTTVTVGNNGTLPCKDYCSNGTNNETPLESICVDGLNATTLESVGCESESAGGLTCYCNPMTCQGWAEGDGGMEGGGGQCDFLYLPNVDAADYVLSPPNEGQFRDVCCKTTCQKWAEGDGGEAGGGGLCDFGYLPNYDALDYDVYPGNEPQFKKVCCMPDPNWPF
jgi:hypothetical protein